MTDKKDIFDLNDVSDIPERMVVIPKADRNKQQRLLSLFDLKSVLTISEAMVASYRLYGKEVLRCNMSSNLHNLVKKKILKQVAIGTFEKI